jgi:hypothetical protein
MTINTEKVKQSNLFKILDLAIEKGFTFPAKNTTQIYLFIREWLEAQDIFIVIKKYEGMTKPYLHELRIGNRVVTPTAVDSCETAKLSVEKAILYCLNQKVFANDNK